MVKGDLHGIRRYQNIQISVNWSKSIPEKLKVPWLGRVCDNSDQFDWPQRQYVAMPTISNTLLQAKREHNYYI